MYIYVYGRVYIHYAYISKMYTIFNTFYYYLIPLRQLLLALLSTILPISVSFVFLTPVFSVLSSARSVTYRRLASRGLIFASIVG